VASRTEKALGEFAFHPSTPDAAEDEGVLMDMRMTVPPTAASWR